MVDVSVSGITYLSNSVSMNCMFTLPGVAHSDVNVTLKWTKDGSIVNEGTAVKLVTLPSDFGLFGKSVIAFPSLLPANNGLYLCSTTIIRKGRVNSTVTGSGHSTLMVLCKHLRTFCS